MLLDLRLPARTACTLVRQLRAESQIPVIILTGQAEETDRVMGLELGADDYLTKPFSPRELLARIRAVLRRTHSEGPAGARDAGCRAYRFPGWELNLRTRRLTASDGRDVDLSNGEFNLLVALCERRRPGRQPRPLAGLSAVATATKSTTARSTCRSCACDERSKAAADHSSRNAAWATASR